MKVEVGKCYLMANGKTATIMEYQPGKDFPFRGMFGTEYDGGSMSWNGDGYQCNGAIDYQLRAELAPPPPIEWGDIKSVFPSHKDSFLWADDNFDRRGENIRDQPVTIEVPILGGVSPEIATMAALENVMLDALSNRDLPLSSRVRVANWFAERYGDDMNGGKL